ncbi:MAG TPA: hypothetical protein VM493_02920 [Vicinamibacterales bacterium]|nr:hypothetical protein [Vicinamibacterales bacterium]
MANQDRPNQNANKSKAEGERWSSDPNSVRNADRDELPVEQYDSNDTDDAGGISNRPLSDELSNQEGLPSRGTARDSSGNPNATRPEGDYEEREQ